MFRIQGDIYSCLINVVSYSFKNKESNNMLAFLILVIPDKVLFLYFKYNILACNVVKAQLRCAIVCKTAMYNKI